MVFLIFVTFIKKQVVFDFLRLYKKRLPEVFGNLLNDKHCSKLSTPLKGCNLSGQKFVSCKLTAVPRKRYFL
uniref:Uncharacterized protein n=1 Tax=Siphoviridae sp. ctOsn3 TaxID=2823577 RepID=A0A8S5LG68_9CAUD|nr:MAG TPA: hypothetical protein [Siphoviridae sp. ctOsn3]